MNRIHNFFKRHRFRIVLGLLLALILLILIHPQHEINQDLFVFSPDGVPVDINITGTLRNSIFTPNKFSGTILISGEQYVGVLHENSVNIGLIDAIKLKLNNQTIVPIFRKQNQVTLSSEELIYINSLSFDSKNKVAVLQLIWHNELYTFSQ